MQQSAAARRPMPVALREQVRGHTDYTYQDLQRHLEALRGIIHRAEVTQQQLVNAAQLAPLGWWSHYGRSEPSIELCNDVLHEAHRQINLTQRLLYQHQHGKRVNTTSTTKFIRHSLSMIKHAAHES